MFSLWILCDLRGKIVCGKIVFPSYNNGVCRKSFWENSRKKPKMNNKKIIIGICTVLLIAIVSAVAMFFFAFFYALDRSFTALTNWQVGWALEDSIRSFYHVNKRLPESWEEVKDSYIANKFHISGYGFDVNRLDEAIDINFQFLKEVNQLKTQKNQQPDIKTELVLRLKFNSNNILLEEQNNRLAELVLRVLDSSPDSEIEEQPDDKSPGE